MRGFEQEKCFDYHETFAIVVKPISYKVLFAIASGLDLEIEQLDVRTAFLYGAIDEEIFVEQPTGQEDGSNRVSLLNKALYGLKQAPRIWFFTLATFLNELCFSPLSADLAVFARDNIFIAVYVDDMLIVEPSITEIEAIKQALRTRFNMSDLGSCHYYLGMSVRRDRLEQALFSVSAAILSEPYETLGWGMPNLSLQPWIQMSWSLLKKGTVVATQKHNGTHAQLDHFCTLCWVLESTPPFQFLSSVDTLQTQDRRILKQPRE